MRIHQIEVGNMQNFTYILEDEKTGEAILVDPSWDLDKVEQLIIRNNFKIKYIVNTHHHFDHTIGNEAMVKSTGAKIIQHESSTLQHDISVKNGDKIQFGSSQVTVLHTPGHSKDSVCLLGDGKIVTGDTLFVGNCGRIDLPGGSAHELYYSIFDVISKLDNKLVVYPGHNYGTSPISTLGEQKKTNFVMQKRTEQEFVELLGG